MKASMFRFFQIAQNSMLRGGYVELAVAVSIILTAFFGSLHNMRGQGYGAFYQSAFGPAIFLACKGTLVEPDAATLESAPVKKFLTLQADTFDCKDLPAQVNVGPVQGFSIQILYLLIVSGAIWSITGVAWLSLNYLGALFVAGVAAATYGTCRLFVPIPWAVAATAGFLMSGPHRDMILNFRDYSKAPFLLGIIFASGLMLKYSSNRRHVILSAAAAGLTAGLGFGFRTDLLLAVPFFFLVLALFLIRKTRKKWSLVAICTAAFITSFVVTSAPMLNGYRGGGTIWHVTLLGLTTPFNEPLGLTDTVYDIGDLYLDQSTGKFIQQYAAMAVRDPNTLPQINFYNDQYARYSRASLLEFARQFPADVVTRAIAAFIRVLDNNGPFRRLIASIGLVTFLVAVVIIGELDPVMGMFFAAIGIYFGSSLALQFDPRHAFHVGFVVWLATAVVMNWVIARLLWDRFEFLGRTSLRFSEYSVQSVRMTQIRSAAKALAITLAAVLLLALLLAAVRAYQQTRTKDLFLRYLSATRQKIDVQEIEAGGLALLKPRGAIPDLYGKMTAIDERKFGNFYLVLTLDGQECDKSEFQGTVLYRKEDPFINFSRAMSVKLQSGGSKSYVMVPVSNCIHECGMAHFEGIQMAEEMRRCLVNLEAVKSARELPLPLVLKLEPGWQDKPLYQRFR